MSSRRGDDGVEVVTVQEDPAPLVAAALPCVPGDAGRRVRLPRPFALLLGAAAVFVAGEARAAAALQLHADIGFGGRYPVGFPAPVRIRVGSSPDEPVRRVVISAMPEGGPGLGGARLERETTLAPGAFKLVELPLRPGPFGGVRVSAQDPASGAVLAEELFTGTGLPSSTPWVLLVGAEAIGSWREIFGPDAAESVVGIAPAELPSCLPSYDGIGAIVWISSDPWRALDESQVEALAGFVWSGGALLFHAGLGPPQGALGERLLGGAQPGMDAAGWAALPVQPPMPPAWTRPIGWGEVRWLDADLLDPATVIRLGADPLEGARLLAPARWGLGPRMRGLADAIRNQRGAAPLAYLGGIRLPRRSAVAAFLAAYLALGLGCGFLIGWRLRRPEAGWAWALAAGILFAGLAYRWGERMGRRGLHWYAAQTLIGCTDQPGLRGWFDLGVVTGRKHELELDLPPDTWLDAGRAGLAGASPTGRWRADGTTLVGVPLEAGSMATCALERFEREQPAAAAPRLERATRVLEWPFANAGSGWITAAGNRFAVSAGSPAIPLARLAELPVAGAPPVRMLGLSGTLRWREPGNRPELRETWADLEWISRLAGLMADRPDRLGLILPAEAWALFGGAAPGGVGSVEPRGPTFRLLFSRLPSGVWARQWSPAELAWDSAWPGSSGVRPVANREDRLQGSGATALRLHLAGAAPELAGSEWAAGSVRVSVQWLPGVGTAIDPALRGAVVGAAFEHGGRSTLARPLPIPGRYLQGSDRPWLGVELAETGDLIDGWSSVHVLAWTIDTPAPGATLRVTIDPPPGHPEPWVVREIVVRLVGVSEDAR